MNWFDVAALIILFRSSYVGFRHGLSMELFRFLGLIVSGFAAFYYYAQLADILTLNTSVPPALANTISFLGILVFGVMLFRMLGALTRKIMQLSFTANFDSVGGIICGFFKGIVITSFIVVLLQQVPSQYMRDSIESTSFSGQYFVKISSAIYSLVRRLHPEGLSLP